jgi:hypothetical protein
MESRKTVQDLTRQIADTADKNNNFYDNEKTHTLKGGDIQILGEIENPGKASLSGINKRSVIVKETMLTPEGKDKFVGAYRYDGYSLFDILTNRFLKKKNAAEFGPIIDLYVIIENDQGEKVVLSWGEIFYPTHLHQIIIATEVAPIIPSKTKDAWPIPAMRKLIVGSDLITERNISNPTKLTIVSYKRSIKVNKDLTPLFSPDIKIKAQNKTLDQLNETGSFQNQTYNTIFYGRGRGIHTTEPFTGICIKDYFAKLFPVDQNKLKTGFFVFVGLDGYRIFLQRDNEPE